MGFLLWVGIAIAVILIIIFIIKKLGSDSGEEEEHKSVWAKIRDACCKRG